MKEYPQIVADLKEKMEKGDTRQSLVYLPIDKLYPHPANPRKDLGDLAELADSIKAKGVMQNLTVVPGHYLTDEELKALNAEYKDHPTEELRSRINQSALHRPVEDGYTIIIGHRRHAAGKIAEVTELPCIITEMTEQEQVATMLLENMQRSDLTVYEQAQGFKQLSMDFGMSAESIAEKTGFSASTVRRRLKIAELNQDILKDVSNRQITMADFERLDKIEDPKLRDDALKEIGTSNFANRCASAEQEEKNRRKKEEWRRICLEAGLKEISENVGNKRDKYASVSGCIYGNHPDRSQIEEYLTDDKELFFYVDRWCYLYIVTPRTDEDEQTAKNAALAKEEQERNDACAALKEAFERAYILRLGFIKSYTEADAKKHLADILRLGVEINAHDRNYVDMTTFYELIGISSERLEELEDDDLAPQWHEFELYTTTKPAKALLNYIYATVDDAGNKHCYQPYTWRSNRGGFDNENQHHEYLRILYDNLERLGYEMSDEEKALMDGTSELYYKEKEEESDND